MKCLMLGPKVKKHKKYMGPTAYQRFIIQEKEHMIAVSKEE